MKLTKQSLKYPQIDAAMRYIYDNFDNYGPGTDLTDIVEFGVYKCGSMKKICSYLRDNNWWWSYVIGIDSWEGLPAESDGVSVFKKFSPGAYKTKKPNKDKLRKIFWPYIDLIDKNFKDLNNEDTSLLMKCMLVHIDCDLYSSTKQALTWCFDNKLLGKHSLIAFDEFRSTDELSGEELAWTEICDQYPIYVDEIWHNTYYDKQYGTKFRQSVWEITSIE